LPAILHWEQNHFVVIVPGIKKIRSLLQTLAKSTSSRLPKKSLMKNGSATPMKLEQQE